MPPPHPERHPRCVPAAGGGRSRRALRRRLRARDHPREPADPRDPAGEHGARAHRARRGGAHLARRGRRQHPQRHRQPDRGHRSAGAVRHPAARTRAASRDPQPSRAVRAAAQVQHRLRRRRPGRVARGHERHRLHRRARHGGGRRLSRRGRRHHRPPRLRARPRRADRAGGLRAGRDGAGARLHRARRPHRSDEGAHEVRARPARPRAVPRGGGEAPRPRRSRGSRSRTARRARRSTVSPTSASTRSRSRARSTPASCCRSASSPSRSCADSPASPSIAATATSGSRSGRTSCSSGIDTVGVDAVQREIETLGLGWRATSVRAGLVACTGNTGCKFSASDTKRHALAIADHCDRRVALDVPVNVHLTGCHHSCAQHYIGDVGLLAAKVSVSRGCRGRGLPPLPRRRLRRRPGDRARGAARRDGRSRARR